MVNLIRRFFICWPLILIISLVYLLLWETDQGIDIMISLTQNDWDFNSFCFMFITLLLVIEMTYLGIQYERTFENKAELELDPYYSFPSILASILILVVGYSIVNAAGEKLIYGDLNHIGHYILWPSILFFLIGFKIINKILQNLSNEENSLRETLISILFIVSIIPYLITLSEDEKHWYYEFILFTPLSISFLFLIFSNEKLFSFKEKFRAKQKEDNILFRPLLKDFFFYFWLIPPIIVLAFNWSFHSSKFGPLSSFFICLFIPLFILHPLYKWFLKKLEPSTLIIIFILIIALIYVLFNSNSLKKNQINLCEIKKEEIYERPKVQEYLHDWLNYLDTNYPQDSSIYLVASKGGGIRAAIWTNLVLGKFEKDSNGEFYRQCLLLTGSSGGMVGQGLYTSFRNLNQEKYLRNAFDFYSNEDFLSPMICRTFGFELIKNIFPKPDIYDRHEVLESTFSNYFKNTFNNNALSQPYFDYLKFNQHNPLLISTSYDCGNRQLAYISPVQFRSKFENRTTDFMKVVEEEYGTNFQPSLVSGIMLSARFPKVSTKGRLKSGHAFLDAGMFDNIGSLILLEVLDELHIAMKQNKCWKAKYNIKVVIIENQVDSLETSTENGLLGDIFGVASEQANNQQYLKIIDKISLLKNSGLKVEINSKDGLRPSSINLLPNEFDKKVIYPLGWSISKEATENMFRSLQLLDF